MATLVLDNTLYQGYATIAEQNNISVTDAMAEALRLLKQQLKKKPSLSLRQRLEKRILELRDLPANWDYACIAELNQLATVLSLPDKNGDVLVRAGIIKTKVPLNGLKQPEKLVKETKPQTKAQQRYSRLTGDANRPNGRVERVQRTAKMECNLLGLTVDEALPEVDSFIDRAILNGQTVVYLIHGNGTGALRTAIHKHLRGNRMVKSFRLGRYGEGESGVTVVELK